MQPRSKALRLLVLLISTGMLALGAVTAPLSASADPDPDVKEPDSAGVDLLDATPVPMIVETDGGAPVVSKDDYLNGRVTLDGLGHEMEIKGRGNTTWGMPKKPYKIKLETAASLIGSAAQEDWVLLANYADRSELRTSSAFTLAARTQLAWTPQSRFVDLVVNGESRGLYLLTEQVEKKTGRVDLPDDGYLLEVDQKLRRSGDPGFRCSTGLLIGYKDPDELSGDQKREVKQAIDKFEKVLYGKKFADPEKGYAAYIDVDSAVDWYLVEEFFRNQDSNFYSSVYFSWSPNEKIQMGPVWDFDLSAGTKYQAQTSPQGWHVRLGEHWVARMFEDPAFAAKVKQRWSYLAPVADRVIDQLPAAADRIDTSAAANWSLWREESQATLGSVHANTFDGEVDYLRDWLSQRRAWMSQTEAIFGRAPWSVEEQDEVVYVPVRLLGRDPNQGSVTVDYSWNSGTATRGEDFTVPDGRLVFGPGETEKTIPLTILADGNAEDSESIGLVLRDANGAILGSPAAVTVTVRPSDQRVDARISVAGKKGFAGRGTFNKSAKKQTKKATARVGQRKVFQVRLDNDQDARNKVFVTASDRPGQAVRAKVRYYAGGRDITKKVGSENGWKQNIKPGKSQKVRIVVQPGAKMRAGSRVVAKLTATWKGDENQVDAVKGVVKVRR